jgi:lysophospholipase L1-like esterase
VADGGIAGELSENGRRHTERYLRLFPAASRFVVGFGTNDLGASSDYADASREVIENLRSIVAAIRRDDRQPVLLNVPHARESSFSPLPSGGAREARVYHNARLLEFCRGEGIPLADICSRLAERHLGDDVHPNRAGAEAIAEEVFRTLAR